jgi:hypothetical protein
MVMKKLPFYEFFLQAWRASISPRRVTLILGLVVAISNIVASRLDIVFPYIFSLNKFTLMFPEKIYGEAFFIFLWVVLFFVIGVFGKGNLIVSLSYMAGKTGLPNYLNTFTALKKNFLNTLKVELLALFSLLAVSFIILLPLGIASANNPNVMNLLIILGLITLLPIAIIIFFIKQYSLFYFLLSPVSFRGAIETACTLFSKFFFRSLSFGLFFLALAALFTFCLQMVILGVVFLAQKISLPLEEQIISFAASFVFFAWFAIFQQALWLAFFKSIAGMRETQKVVVEKEKEAALAGNIPEIPPVKNEGL